jgi:hypothetical protein
LILIVLITFCFLFIILMVKNFIQYFVFDLLYDHFGLITKVTIFKD